MQWNPKEKTKNPTPVLSVELQEAQRKEIWGTLHSLAIRPPGVQPLDSNNDQINPRVGCLRAQILKTRIGMPALPALSSSVNLGRLVNLLFFNVFHG